MTQEQLFEEIRNNKLTSLRVYDWNNAKLMTINEKNSDNAISKLQDRLENYSSYKRLIVYGAQNEDTKNTACFQYQLDMKGGDKNSTSISHPNGAITPDRYIDTVLAMMKENAAINQKLFELTVTQKQNDPNAWMPLVDRAIAFLHGSPLPGAIQGPPKQIIKGDIEEKKLSPDECLKLMETEFKTLTTSISSEQYLTLLQSLNAVPDVKNKIGSINLLLQKIAANPVLLDMALNYLK